jgi:hypothetical protein
VISHVLTLAGAISEEEVESSRRTFTLVAAELDKRRRDEKSCLVYADELERHHRRQAIRAAITR